MKRLECSVARALGLFLVITSLWGVAANAAHYTIIELGKLPGGSYPVEGYAINNAGQVSGLALASDERYHAFLWQDGVMQDLNVGTNSSFGGSINDAGHIVGTFTTDYDLNTEGRDHAFLYANGTVVDLSAQFGRYLVPGGINNSGHFVGTVATDGGELSSFIYSNGSFVMPDFGFPTRMSDINDGGLIAGSAIFPGQTDFHAAFFRNGSVIDLGLSSGAVNGQAGRLNDRGEVVGISYRADGRHHGFVYSRGRISNAGTLPGDQQSWMSDINNRRVAVGASESPDEFARAVVWANGVLRDLNRLIPRHSGWFLHHANAINDRGQIVGVGFKDGEYRAFLLTPVKPPPLPKRGKED